MNKVVLMGRLTKDPEIKYTSTNNTALCSFTLAVDKKFQKPGEEKQADFLQIKAWGKTAEFCNNYFTKGMRVAITGRVETNNWDDNDGKRHYNTEVVVEEAFFADSKRDGAQGSSGNQKKPSVDFGKSDDATDGFYPLEEDDDLPF